MTEIQAIGRLSNPFLYQTNFIHCRPIDETKDLDFRLNAMAQDGWRLHTIKHVKSGVFFCVWEKLDYEEKKN
jgi:hypothetical protein